jgi:hypothetical protein
MAQVKKIKLRSAKDDSEMYGEFTEGTVFVLDDYGHFMCLSWPQARSLAKAIVKYDPKNAKVTKAKRK